MNNETQICSKCGEQKIKIIFRLNNKILKEIWVCNCTNENSDT